MTFHCKVKSLFAIVINLDYFSNSFYSHCEKVPDLTNLNVGVWTSLHFDEFFKEQAGRNISLPGV